MENVFDILYNFITTYFIRSDTVVPYQQEVVGFFIMAMTLGICWFGIFRPFYLFIKYGMFGSMFKKSRAGAGRRRIRDDDED